MPSPLAAWANFYVIAGTAAATLTGLMFVVITLVAGTARRSPSGLGIYSTPTVVHLAAALVIAVLLGAPWPDTWEASIPLGALGLVGLVYSGIVVRRAGDQGGYHPVLEDWICHTILPPLAYSAIIVSALALPRWPTPTLFGIGAVVIVFLVLGIHNAWDIVTFITVAQSPPGDDTASQG